MKIFRILLFVLLLPFILMATTAETRLGRLGQFENGTALINDALTRLDAQLTAELGAPIVTNVPVSQVTATNVLTVSVNPTTNDTMTIGDYTYTFVTNAVDDGDVLIGAAVTNTQDNIITAVDADGVVTMGAFSTNNTSILTAVAGGVATNIACTETFTSVSNLFTDATMVGGVDMTETDADILIYTDGLYIKTSSTSWEKISYD
jgi:hypothetical protein